MLTSHEEGPVDDSTLELLEEMERFEGVQAVSRYIRRARELDNGEMSVEEFITHPDDLLTDAEADMAINRLISEDAKTI